MEHILINSYKHLSFYEKEWSSILKVNENNNPFMEYNYVYNWWVTLEIKKQIEIHAIKENNKVIAFFPFEVKKIQGVPVYYFLTLNENQVMDKIVKKNDTRRTIMFLFDTLMNEHKHIVFQLNELSVRGETFLKLSEYLVARNLKLKDINNPMKKDIYDELTNLERLPVVDDKHIDRKSLIFSANTVRSLLCRNLLWANEKYIPKKIRKPNMFVKNR
ncbi:hypothetical protein [Bacillus sp. FJAT-22090]|uniref:hypothetical protein n=1 Tax=Bacillus sp. FJAT-22090 TaxID=1581038 RepID=UPI00119CEB43|nr:hypothetical protein [Bacillus sp. FJAT-22090]